MIQINLLPDLKQEYIKSQRTRLYVLAVSLIIVSVFVISTLSLFTYVNVAQRQHTNNLQDDIDRLSEEFQSIQDIDKVVTLQNQIKVLPELHEEKPLTSKLSDYLTILTPNKVTLSNIELNFDENTILLNGTGENVKTVNKFADTLKNTIFVTYNDETPNEAFDNVTLKRISTGNEDGAGFEISADFDSKIFSVKDNAKVSVPSITTSNSEKDRPQVLFDAPNQEDSEE